VILPIFYVIISQKSNQPNKQTNMDVDAKTTPSPLPFYVDGLVAVVYGLCEPEQEPIPELDVHLELFRKLHEASTMRDAITVFKDACLSGVQLDRLNSRLLDGMQACVCQRNKSMDQRGLDGLEVSGVRKNSKLFLQVADAVYTAMAVVHTGNVTLLDYAQQRGVDVTMLTNLHEQAILSDSAEMLTRVWRLAPYTGHYSDHTLGTIALSDGKVNSLRWMVDQKLTDANKLAAMYDSYSRNLTPARLAALKYVLDIGGRPRWDAMASMTPIPLQQEALRYGNERRAWDLRRYGRGFSEAFVLKLLACDYPLRRFDLHYAIHAFYYNVVGALLESGLVRITDEVFQHHVLETGDFTMFDVCFRHGYDGKEALHSGRLSKPNSMGSLMWGHVVRRIDPTMEWEPTRYGPAYAAHAPMMTRSKRRKHRH
jgi:hypothetical protein